MLEQARPLTSNELITLNEIYQNILVGPDQVSPTVMDAYNFLNTNFAEWLVSSGYDQIDPSAPYEQILAQLQSYVED